MADQQMIWEDKIKGFESSGSRDLQQGPVTDTYKANRDEMINILNRAMASEWSAFLQYWHHYFMSSGIHSAEIRNIFKEHAEQEYDHAQQIGDRIQQLGGVPCDKPSDIDKLTAYKVDYGHNLQDMIEDDLKDERITISFYSEIVRYAGFNDSTTRLIMEGILAEENEHANDWQNLLYAVDATTGQETADLHQEVLEQARQQPPQQRRRVA